MMSGAITFIAPDFFGFGALSISPAPVLLRINWFIPILALE